MTDPIADLLTRIRNAAQRRLVSVIVPYSRAKENVVSILASEGFIESYEVIEKEHKNLVLKLKYKGAKCVINHLERVSRPGLRNYQGYKELKPILRGYGIGIISTPQGVITDKKARQLKVGGEVLCLIW